jgi:hypothetical protein
MRAKACGFEFEVKGDCLNIFLPDGQFDVDLPSACRLGSYLSEEGLLNAKVISFRIFKNDGQELKYNQLTETFNLT